MADVDEKRSGGTPCPCGSSRTLAQCCGLYLNRRQNAPGCEELMRSRYTAFVQRDVDYLLNTWHPDTRPTRLDLDSEPAPKWLGLKIVAVTDDPPTVEFVARFRVGGKGRRLHERSRFVFEGGRWWYYDGVLDPGP